MEISSISTLYLLVLIAPIERFFVALVFVMGAVGLLAFELQHRLRPGNRLILTAGDWTLDTRECDRYIVVGILEFQNQACPRDIFVPEVEAQVKLFSSASLQGMSWTVDITPEHPDLPVRPDGYWFAYIVTDRPTRMKLTIAIQGQNTQLASLQSAWVQVSYVTYGPEGRIPKLRHIVVALQYPNPTTAVQWQSLETVDLMPIKTHILSQLDNPVEVVRHYVSPHAQPGDIVAIGETPIAIMQERFRHPTDIEPSWVAQRLCYFFLPTSNLATACGLQSLIDIVGPIRVVTAFLIGAIAKGILHRPGVFYQLAGEQARLIDDVSGTLPPYDQFIVLGPENPQEVVDCIYRETGLAAAIVDVNNLRAVKVLATSAGVSELILKKSLLDNPAGNTDEQTPVILIRPKK